MRRQRIFMTITKFLFFSVLHSTAFLARKKWKKVISSVRTTPLHAADSSKTKWNLAAPNLTARGRFQVAVASRSLPWLWLLLAHLCSA